VVTGVAPGLEPGELEAGGGVDWATEGRDTYPRMPAAAMKRRTRDIMAMENRETLRNEW